MADDRIDALRKRYDALIFELQGEKIATEIVLALLIRRLRAAGVLDATALSEIADEAYRRAELLNNGDTQIRKTVERLMKAATPKPSGPQQGDHR